jgi:hypothetical protein
VTPEPVGPGQSATDQDQQPRPLATACRSLETGEVVIAAPKPAVPIAKGLPGPGLLAHLIVSKYTDHMPLHRLQRAYERQGCFLHRSTLCDWLSACADLLRPLYDLMVCVVLQSRALHTDDTTVKMQELGEADEDNIASVHDFSGASSYSSQPVCSAASQACV